MKNIKDATLDEINDFSEIAAPLVKFIRDNWSTDVKPKDYDEFMEDYEEYKGQGEDQYELDFDGLLDGGGYSFPFPVKLATPYVAYDDNEQGRDPLQVMVGAILAYGISIGERREKLDDSNDMFIRNIKWLLEDIKGGEIDNQEVLSRKAELGLSGLKIKYPELFVNEEK
ncbi:MAG: hypothetical protein SLAVMIC_00016 [uncultured marine phage]|uniref:Uncharacterized protein n=1 Tax=uncultured marine phage TaxID=707152 RepID=A0A8D9CEH3_9VIRU|nr:MAG: hypothetical protein SLAVMIC_00016 [uncultured marine phage]